MIRYWPVPFIFFLSAVAAAAATGPVRKIEDGVKIRVRPHTPLQMAAFYEARGFPVSALGELQKACFMTVSVVNLRREIAWLEPARWEIYDKAGKPVPRLDKAYWDNQWKKHSVSAAARTAFRWTQLPESRDLRPDEPVGGNIAFIPRNGPFSLETRFYLGADKNGGEVKIRLGGLSCPGRP
jgi:hypothetical protein